MVFALTFTPALLEERFLVVDQNFEKDKTNRKMGLKRNNTQAND